MPSRSPARQWASLGDWDCTQPVPAEVGFFAAMRVRRMNLGIMSYTCTYRIGESLEDCS